MIPLFKYLFLFLIIPGFVFTAVVGLITTWIDRKVSAKVQWRTGPPWFQPFADIAKLLGKETIVPEGGSTITFLAAPIVAIAGVTLVSTMLWMLNVIPKGGFVGDLIVVIYLLTLPSLALIIGGSASRNPLAAVGSSREMKLILAYELPFILAAFTVVAKVGSILVGQIVSYQAGNGMIFLSFSGAIACVVTLLVAQAKLGYLPFDMPEAEQELMGGPLLEYSGPALAAFKLSKAMLFFTLPVFMITLFLGGIEITSIAGILWFVLKYVIIVTLVVLIKNTNPRIRIDQAVRFFWGPVTVLAALGFVLALLGL
ncbi:respiratory chain complex I subunit 1 family protein [Candidatus Margulisiibacteriota bacterium]